MEHGIRTMTLDQLYDAREEALLRGAWATTNRITMEIRERMRALMDNPPIPNPIQ